MTWPDDTTAEEAALFVVDWLVTHGYPCSYEAHVAEDIVEHAVETTPDGLRCLIRAFNLGYDGGFGLGFRYVMFNHRQWDGPVRVYDDLRSASGLNTTPVRT